MKKCHLKWIMIFAIITVRFKGANAQRRVTNGREVRGEKRYMVYFLEAPPQNFTAWTCGGAIISKNYVLTSAACVTTVPRAYVIAGYRKYVNAKDMEKDGCVMYTRRKIVNYCHPKGFNPERVYGYDNYWNYGDICIAGVDVPFDFNDKNYYEKCSYPPRAIEVNYNYKFHASSRDVISLGWGHADYYRPEGSTLDLNERYLQYSSGSINSNADCLRAHEKAFENIKLTEHLEKYLICVNEAGNLDEDGQVINVDRDYYNTCNTTYDPLVGRNANVSEDCLGGMALRGKINQTNELVGGICQNDHGGPLVGWVGGTETVVAVASLFAVDLDMRCRTPYLYTATSSINKVLACFLWANFTSRRSKSVYCDDAMTETNYAEQDITWP